MAAYVLHQNATVLCAHPPGGRATPLAPDQRVKVSGQKVVTLPGPYTITGCPLQSKCVSATWLSAAKRVRASGRFVLFKEGQAKCVPNGTGLNIVATQTRVKVS